MTDLTRANESWLTSPTHQQWLRDQGQALVDFAKAARVPCGFAALDPFGRRPNNAPADTITTARMVHSFSLAHIQGLPGCAPLIDHGLAALAGPLRDAVHGGWFARPAAEDGNTRKDAYLHAFVALADVLDEDLWLDRALSIAEKLVHQHAAQSGYLPVEHFDSQWQPLPDYNRDNPADGFRPFGKTPGHAFEWARLLLHLEAARKQRGLAAPEWLLEDARRLFASACQFGWNVDGDCGIVYTVDWNHQPLVRERLHWTLAEASAAAAALLQRSGEHEYEVWYQQFWDYIDLYMIDRQNGSWHHELGIDNLPSQNIWPGKPDLYHAYQATLLPRLPLAISLASALKLRR